MTRTLTNMYDISERIRGIAKLGYCRPTLSEFFKSVDYTPLWCGISGVPSPIPDWFPPEDWPGYPIWPGDPTDPPPPDADPEVPNSGGDNGPYPPDYPYPPWPNENLDPDGYKNYNVNVLRTMIFSHYYETIKIDIIPMNERYFAIGSSDSDNDDFFGRVTIIRVNPDNPIDLVLGTPVAINTPYPSHELALIYDEDKDKLIVNYKNMAMGNRGESKVMDVNMYTPTEVSSANGIFSSRINYVTGAYDSYNKRGVIAYTEQDGGDYTLKAKVCELTGTEYSDIWYGSEVILDATESAVIDEVNIRYDSINNKIIISYVVNSYSGYVMVGTVSGNSITFGDRVRYSNAHPSYNSCDVDTVNNKFIITYYEFNNEDEIDALWTKIGTIDGNSISFGDPIIANNGTSYFSTTTCNSTNGTILYTYMDAGNNYWATARVGRIYGDDIHFSDPTVLATDMEYFVDTAYNSFDESFVTAYYSSAIDEYGKVKLMRVN